MAVAAGRGLQFLGLLGVGSLRNQAIVTHQMTEVAVV